MRDPFPKCRTGAIVILATACCTACGTASRPEDLLELVAPEIHVEPDCEAPAGAEGSAAGTERGIRQVCLAPLADDAVLFRPGPVEGRAWLAERPASNGLLTWFPTPTAARPEGLSST